MNFESGNVYHVYNRGNKQQIIFFSRENYLYFLNKIKKQLTPYADVLCWCLMHNHFHFMIHVKNHSSHDLKSSDELQINRSIGTILRSYTRAIQKQEHFTGSLFQQKTKAKNIFSSGGENHLQLCFHYIHQNPMKANLVNKMEDWEFSSFQDYVGLRNGILCNQQFTKKLMNLPIVENELYKQSYENLNFALVEHLFIE